MRRSIAAWALSGAIACGHGVPLVDPAPVRGPVMGDANGDGLADVSDAVWMSSTLFRGGERGPCFGATDVLPDGELRINDVYALLAAVLPGDSDLKALGDACDGAATPEAPDPVALALDIDAPERVEAAAGEATTLDATVELSTPDSPVQAWNLSIVAEGCAVTAATTAGTAGAATFDDPPGQRGGTSYDYHALTAEGGAVAGVVLDWRADNVLSPREQPWPLLALTLTATAPDRGCETCTISLANGAHAGGPPLRNLATVGGWSYPLPRVDRTVKICAD